MQRYDIIHSPDGVELDVLTTIAEDLDAAWVIAQESFPQEHVGFPEKVSTSPILQTPELEWPGAL